MPFIDRIVSFIGNLVSWLNLILVLVIVLDVCFRYIASQTSVASFELEWHLFALIFMLGAGYALQHDRHVRVDVLYSRFSERGQAWVNILGCVLFLLPFCAVVFVESLSFVANSYQVNEGSPDPGGLPARYLVKGAIPVGIALLGLQGISNLIRNLKTVVTRD